MAQFQNGVVALAGSAEVDAAVRDRWFLQTDPIVRKPGPQRRKSW
jgi:hypothetical protein